MIEVFTHKDLEAVLAAYIKHREITGLSRDTAKFGAIEETLQAVRLRKALMEEGALPPDEALMASKRQTDKLNPKAVSQ